MADALAASAPPIGQVDYTPLFEALPPPSPSVLPSGFVNVEPPTAALRIYTPFVDVTPSSLCITDADLIQHLPVLGERLLSSDNVRAGAFTFAINAVIIDHYRQLKACVEWLEWVTPFGYRRTPLVNAESVVNLVVNITPEHCPIRQPHRVSVPIVFCVTYYSNTS